MSTTNHAGANSLHRISATSRHTDSDGEVEQITRNGRDYLVFPVIAAREMILDYPEYGTRELLSANRLRESADMWAGTPITFIHPENPQRTADIAKEYTETIIGQAYDPQVIDGEKLRVQAWVDVDKAEDIGGLASKLVGLLQDGEEVGVSAGYATLDDDRSGGRFNDESYDIEQGHLIPDHIAVFPSDEFTARCSWEDGCGAPRMNYSTNASDRSDTDSIAMSNSDVNRRGIGECSEGPCSCGVHANARETARTPEYDGLTSAEWDDPDFTDYVEEYYSRVDEEAPDNITVNTASEDALSFVAERTLVGEADGDSAGQVRSYPVVNLDDELNEDALESARLLAHNSPAEESILDTSAELLEKHSGEWPSGEEYDFDDRENYQPDIETASDDSAETLSMMRANVGSPDGDLNYLRAGEYVAWDSDDDGTTEPKHGRIRSVTHGGCVSILDQQQCVDSDSERVANIAVYEDGEPTGQRVLKTAHDGGPNEDNLRSWDAPRPARDADNRPKRINEVDESDMLDFEEGEMVRLQPLPDVTGRIDHIPDEQSGDVTIAMVDLFDMGVHTISIGMGSLMPVDAPGTRANAITVDIGDREVDLSPPESVKNAAELALEKKEEYSDEIGDCGTGRGEQRANQIVDEDLAPEDFLTRDNGTPIPTYLDSHDEDVDGIDSTPTDWGKEEWLGRVTGDSDDVRCGPIQYALWGGTATGTGVEWAEGVKDDLEAAIEAAEDFTLNAQIVTMDNETITPDDLSLRHNVVPYLQSTWDMENPGHVEAFVNSLDPDEPADSQAFSATIARNYEGVDAVDVQSELAEAEGRDTLTIGLNFEPEEYEIDGGVGPDETRLNARDHITPFLADKWGCDTVEATAVINGLDPKRSTSTDALFNVYPGDVEPSDLSINFEDSDAIGGGSDADTDDGTGSGGGNDADTATTVNGVDEDDAKTLFAKFLNAVGFDPETETSEASTTANSAADGDDDGVTENTENGEVPPELKDEQFEDEDDDEDEDDEDDSETQTNTESSSETDSEDTESDETVTTNAMSKGDMVQWDWQGGTAYGMIDEIVKDGSRTVDGNERSAEPNDGQMIAVIEEVEQDTGEETGQRVLKYINVDGDNENNLRSWSGPTNENAQDTEATESEDSDDADEPTVDSTNTEDTNMSEDEIELETNLNTIATNSTFGVSELEDMDDQQVASIEQTILTHNESLVDDGEDTEETTENAMDGDDEDEEDEDEDEEDEEMNNNYEQKVNQLQQELQEVKAMAEDAVNQKANAEKEQKARIIANNVEGMTKEAALQLGSEEFERLAEAHGNTVNYGAVPGGVDRDGIQTNTEDQDFDDYPAGGRSNWEARKQSGD